MEKKPLVSILIITYNSADYVIETLDSALAQTYNNIEIIITDDCSTDNTVSLCRNWMEKHSNIDKTIKLVEAKANTGVSGNCNRGLQASNGEWIKTIAGDDMLAPTAIEDYIRYTSDHPETRHLIAKAVHFVGQLKKEDLLHPDIISQYLYRDEFSVKQQYSVISKTFFGSGPTYFINAEALKEVGGYDERFQMQEDYPLFIKMIRAGYKMMYLDRVTVYKRMVPTSIQYDKDKDSFFSKHQVRLVSEYKLLYRKEAVGPLWKIFHNYSIAIQQAVIKTGNSKKSYLSCFLYGIYYLTDPFVWYSRYNAYKNKRYCQNL